MSWRRFQQFTAEVLLVVLAPWCAGCATEFYLQRSTDGKEGTGGGALAVRVFENRPDLRRGEVSKREIVTGLYRLESGSEKVVREERATRWTATGLAPGRYVLRVRKSSTKRGPRACRRTTRTRASKSGLHETATADEHRAGIGPHQPRDHRHPASPAGTGPGNLSCHWRLLPSKGDVFQRQPEDRARDGFEPCWPHPSTWPSRPVKEVCNDNPFRRHPRCGCCVLGVSGIAQPAEPLDPLLANWTAPPYWTPPVGHQALRTPGAASARISR